MAGQADDLHPYSTSRSGAETPALQFARSRSLRRGQSPTSRRLRLRANCRAGSPRQTANSNRDADRQLVQPRSSIFGVSSGGAASIRSWPGTDARQGPRFFDETLGIRRQKAFWMPRYAGPASDRPSRLTSGLANIPFVESRPAMERWRRRSWQPRARSACGGSAFQSACGANAPGEKPLRPKPRGEGAMQQQ